MNTTVNPEWLELLDLLGQLDGWEIAFPECSDSWIRLFGGSDEVWDRIDEILGNTSRASLGQGWPSIPDKELTRFLHNMHQLLQP